MFKLGLFIILISTLVYATSEVIDLKIGDSFLIVDKNITLINIDDKDDKVILCINNVKVIVNRNLDKTVNDVIISVRSIDENSTRVKFERKCKKCVCDDSCLNNLCFPTKIEIKEIVKVPQQEEILEKVSSKGEIKKIEEMGNNTSLIIAFIILIIAIFIILRHIKK